MCTREKVQQERLQHGLKNMKILLIQSRDKGSSCLLEDGSYTVYDKNPVKLLNELCLMHGSTMQGRKDAYSILMDRKRKAPVLISEQNFEMFFPVLSSTDPKDMLWLSYGDIWMYKQIEDNLTKVYFISGCEADAPVSRRTLKYQIDKCKEYQKYFLEKEKDS